MSWWVKEISAITEDQSERLCIIETDTPNDLPNPVRTKPDPDNPGQTITDYTIIRGSEAYCLSNSKTYKLNSQGQWVEQTNGSGGGGASSADQVSYDNTDSGLTATNVQDAIDELHDTDETQDNTLVELSGENANQQLEIDYAINTGAKNLLAYNEYAPGAVNGVTYTINTDGTITVNGTPQGTAPSYVELKLNGNAVNVSRFCDGQHILSGCPAGGSDSTYRMYAARGVYSRFDYGNGVVLTDTTITDVRLVIYISNGYTANNLVFKPMIREDVIRNATFEPYAPTNRELYETKLSAEDVWGYGQLIPDNADLNDYTTGGKYYGGNSAGSSVLNLPVANGSFTFSLEVKQATPSITYQYLRVCRNADDPYIYCRRRYNSWGSWYRFTGETVVTSTQSLNSPLLLNREEITPLETDVIKEIEETEETE